MSFNDSWDKIAADQVQVDTSSVPAVLLKLQTEVA